MAARQAGVPIVSEVEIALRMLPALRVIATTGTNGKTTTTALIGHLLRAIGHDAVEVGNIGTPVSEIGLRAVHAKAHRWGLAAQNAQRDRAAIALSR